MGGLLRLIEGFSVGGAYALLLAVGANIDTPEAWRWTLAGTAAFGLLGWQGALKRSRAVAMWNCKDVAKPWMERRCFRR
jgi:hypothetical protein